MKKFGSLQKVLLALTVSLVAVGIFVGVAYAASQQVRGTTNHSVYKAGDTVDISGTVNGDVFCAGQTITIKATVNGDVLCAGQTVTVDGTVNGSVRLAGQTVTLGAKVTNAASIAGQDVTIRDTASVGRDASLAGQTVSVDGRIGRDLSGASNSLTLNSPVDRDVVAEVNNLTLDSGAKVAGNLTYTSPHMLQKVGGATVAGRVIYHKGQVQHRGGVGGLFFVKVYWLAALVVATVVLVALFPGLFRRWSPRWGAGFWWALLTGFLAMFIIPAVIVLLMITVVGAPLGLLLLALWAALFLLSMPLAAYFIGSLLVPRWHMVLIALIGSVILGLLELIPIAGWIIGLIAYWLGSGILLTGLGRDYHRPSYSPKAN